MPIAVVVGQGRAEKGEGFGEGATARDDLGAPADDLVDGGELLVKPGPGPRR